MAERVEVEFEGKVSSSKVAAVRALVWELNESWRVF